MVKVIVIRDLKDWIIGINTLVRIRRNVNTHTPRGMYRWGKILEGAMRQSAFDAGIKPTKEPILGIEWRQRKNGKVGELFMRQEGIFLDQMRPHYVNVTRQRTRLLRWALHANGKIRSKARQVASKERDKFSIFVKPHPFTKRGYSKARPKFQRVVQKELALAVNKS